MRIAVIGAGLAGLTAAVEIRRHDADAHIDVFEATDRIGGKLYTASFDAGPTDVGAEAFLTRRPDAIEFFTSLGLADSFVYPSGMRSLVYSEGSTHSLPHSGVMGIPSSSAGVAHLVGLEAAARIDAEHTADPIAWDVGGDRNVGALVRERYGDEVVDRIVSALLGGVYSCTADDLGIRATIPTLATAFDELAESDQPVTLSGAVRLVESKRSAPHGSASQRDHVPATPLFGSFRGGYAELYEALADASGADIYLDAFVSGLERTAAGGYLVSGAGLPDETTYDRVLVATPAPTTALLLKKLAPEAAAELKKVKLADSVVVALRFDTDEGLPDNSGVLIAADEPGLHAKAFTLSSKKWPHIGERGGATVRVSFGRFGDSAVTRAEEDVLVDWALADLKTVTGFDTTAHEPEEIFVKRWFGGLPRYDEHHLATVATVRELLDDVSTLEVTGAWAGGVGVPNVISDARTAATRLMG